MAVARYLIVKYIAEQLLNISRVMKMEQIKWNTTPDEQIWTPFPVQYHKRICKVVLLVFSMKFLRIQRRSSHLSRLYFSLDIQGDHHEGQTPE